MRNNLLPLLSILFASVPFSAFADPPPGPQGVIICGLGGTPEYDAAFEGWGGRLRDVLTQKGGMNCTLLTANAKGAAQSTLESIRAALTAAQPGPEHDLFVFLIGHGSFMKGAAKLNIPGPDLAAADLKAMIDAVPCRRAVVVDGASCSAPFINALSGPNRIIITANKSAEENNATQFMGAFVEALDKGGADQNRDERVSLAEAARQASAITDAWYTGQGWMTTEHALLDDNGDGLGTRPSELIETAAITAASDGAATPDGAAAATCFLIQPPPSPNVPSGIADQYAAALAEVEGYKLKKTGMAEDEYYAGLETLLLKAARLNKELRGGDAPALHRMR